MKSIVLFFALISVANAATDRVLDGKFITNGGATITVPTSTTTLIGNDTTDTLTNKTLTSPVINTPTGLTKSDVGLSNVDNTSDATKNSAVATLTNKTLTAPVINSPTGLVKADVGLSNVDNTSDATKNSATATLTNKTIDYNSNTILNLPSSSPTVTGTAGSPTLITAVGGIAFTGSNYSNVKFIAGDSGAINVTANPQIAAGSSAGQMLTIVSRHATNTVTLEDGNGLSLNGPWVGGLDSVIELMFDGTNWVEKSRR